MAGIPGRALDARRHGPRLRRHHSAGANLAQARVNLERTSIRSPINGYVTNLLVQLGDYAKVGDQDIAGGAQAPLEARDRRPEPINLCLGWLTVPSSKCDAAPGTGRGLAFRDRSRPARRASGQIMTFRKLARPGRQRHRSTSINVDCGISTSAWGVIAHGRSEAPSEQR